MMRPTFILTILEKSDMGGGVRTTLSQGKATQNETRREGLSLRCTSDCCSLRQGVAVGDLLGEIEVEDRVPDQSELLQAKLADAEADAAEGQDTGDTQAAGGGVSALPDAAGAVELWPFAFSLSFWSKVFEMGEGHKTQVVAILTPSAHPGPWLAARAMTLDAFVLTRRQNVHARRHGVQLGQELRRAQLAPKDPPTVQAHFAAGGPAFQCILGAVVGDQSVLDAYSVSCGPLWRDGVNRGPSGEAFHAAAARLVAEQLEIYKLSISSNLHYDPTPTKIARTTKRSTRRTVKLYMAPRQSLSP